MLPIHAWRMRRRITLSTGFILGGGSLFVNIIALVDVEKRITSLLRPQSSFGYELKQATRSPSPVDPAPMKAGILYSRAVPICIRDCIFSFRCDEMGNASIKPKTKDMHTVNDSYASPTSSSSYLFTDTATHVSEAPKDDKIILVSTSPRPRINTSDHPETSSIYFYTDTATTVWTSTTSSNSPAISPGLTRKYDDREPGPRTKIPESTLASPTNTPSASNAYIASTSTSTPLSPLDILTVELRNDTYYPLRTSAFNLPRHRACLTSPTSVPVKHQDGIIRINFPDFAIFEIYVAWLSSGIVETRNRNPAKSEGAKAEEEQQETKQEARRMYTTLLGAYFLATWLKDTTFKDCIISTLIDKMNNPVSGHPRQSVKALTPSLVDLLGLEIQPGDVIRRFVYVAIERWADKEDLEKFATGDRTGSEEFNKEFLAGMMAWLGGAARRGNMARTRKNSRQNEESEDRSEDTERETGGVVSQGDLEEMQPRWPLAWVEHCAFHEYTFLGRACHRG
ncbi:hypothetical protein BCR34DRAFT_665226 [Clohesyomyces aquaticus]|uniref:BTB domain-containing protein n=1 Tax=Clohesyomyces aquaticus TaxID=1231657 RepID=A0A1Y1ZIB3_9PLEO|nr:hypothetical protein BCR34DRAFT_665226 [Clohesyomyces aquaticus]